MVDVVAVRAIARYRGRMRWGFARNTVLFGVAAFTLGGCGSWSLRAPPPGGTAAAPLGVPVAVFARPGTPNPTIVVGPGDTLNGIARNHGVTLEALARINNIPPPYRLRVGQYLLVPLAEAVAQPAPVNSSERIILRPPPGMSARVEPPTAAAPIVATPALPSASPSRGGDVQSAPLAPPTAAPSTPSTPPSTTRSETRIATVPVPPPSESVAVDEAAVGRIPPRGGRNFAWPVRGAIASDFGAKPGGLANDGINIAAARGAPVRAAENGIVSYAGNELRGFGNLILIRHANDWITAYAHLESIDVRTGAVVQRGQVIGRVGQTGNVGEPQLHFEIRRAGTPVNPRQFLAAQAASAER